MFGYSSEQYACAVSDGGTVTHLANCGGYILTRQINDSELSDAAGPYPLFCCKHWESLRQDIDQLSNVVSLGLVTDPFGQFDAEVLKDCFPDIMKQFKLHYVVELSDDLTKTVSRHHQRNVRKSLRSVKVREVLRPHELINDWVSWYEQLTRRHGIVGVSAFSKKSFEQQLAVPGIRVFEAMHGPDRVGAVIWYLSGSHAYYHLGAWNEIGYQQKASFAAFWISLTTFREEGVQMVGLGAGSGLTVRSDGLTRFKAGWSNRRSPVYFCGRVIDRDSYDQLTAATLDLSTGSFFPAYRRD
jgi:hypothetical protein